MLKFSRKYGLTRHNKNKHLNSSTFPLKVISMSDKWIGTKAVTKPKIITVKINLRLTLNSIQVPECINCHDYLCQNHYIESENYTMAVLNAIETAGKETLPIVGGASPHKKKDIIPGWTDYVGPFWE